MERIKVGIKGMDELLVGGLPKRRTVLVSGSSGAGKSIFASHFIQTGVKLGEACLYITLEQGKEKLSEDMKQIGMDFSKMEEKGKLKIIGGPVGDINYFKDRTQADMMDIINEIAEVAKEIDAKRVVLDSVNLFLMLFETDVERRKALAQLTSALEALDCTTLLTCEVKEGTKDISWYGFEEFVVDGVITLYRIPIESIFERSISIVKMRGINHSHQIVTLKIEKKGMVVYPEQKAFHRIGN